MVKGESKPNKVGKHIIYVLVFTSVLFWTIIAIAPYFYMVATSMKTQGEFLSGNALSLPGKVNFTNHLTVLKGSFFSYFKNSVLVVGISSVLLILISAFAAYPLSRMKFKLNHAIYAFVVALMSVPIHVTLIPMFTMSLALNVYDTPWALIGPYVAFNLPTSIFIFHAFMQGIPVDLEQASEIDGCNLYMRFFSLILPLSKPVIATLGIYNGVIMWNEFSFAMVLTQSKNARTLPLSVWEYQGEYSMNIPMIMSVLVLSSLPIILLYVFLQDKLIRGMMAGAIKG